MADIHSLNISIITVNVNGENIQIKRQRSAEWIKICNSPIFYEQGVQINYNNIARLNVKGQEKKYANINQRKKGMSVLSDTVDFEQIKLPDIERNIMQ